MTSHLPGGVELRPFVRQRRPGDVAAQLLQPLAVVCFDPPGYGDTNFFNRLFRRKVTMSPRQYRILFGGMRSRVCDSGRGVAAT